MPIFDQGYQHWQGTLTGHSWRWLAVARHGIRNGHKNRLLRVVMLFAWLPAAGLVAMLCAWGMLEQGSETLGFIVSILKEILGADIISDPKKYRVEFWTLCYDKFLWAELRFAMLIVAIVGPSLISQDLRFNALPLYFSRPLRRIDYFVGKLAVVVYFLLMVLVVPAIIAYVFGLLFSLDLSIIPATLPLLLSVVGFGLLVSLCSGMLILAMSSLTRNSRFVGLAWIGMWLVTSFAALVLDTIETESQRRAAIQAAHQQPPAIRIEAPPAGKKLDPAAQVKARQRDRKFFEDQQSKIEGERRALADAAAQENWQPLVSYTANVARVGRAMIGYNGAIERLGAGMKPESQAVFVNEMAASKYPWYWSAFVLIGILGASAWILNVRVKSLDRLR